MMKWRTKHWLFQGLLLSCLLLGSSMTALAGFAVPASAVYSGTNPNESNPPLYPELGNPLVLTDGSIIDVEWSADSPYTNGVTFEDIDSEIGSVRLESGSQIRVSALDHTSLTAPTAIAMNGDYDQHVELLGQSSLAVESIGSDGSAYGVTFEQQDPTLTASLLLDEASTIELYTESSLDFSVTSAFETWSIGNGVIRLDGGSSLGAMSKIMDDAQHSFTSGMMIFTANSVQITLDNGSEVAALSSAVGDDKWITSYGLYAGTGSFMPIEELNLTLANSSSLFAYAVAEGENNMASSLGVLFASLDANITLMANSEIVVASKGEESRISGIYSGFVQHSDISLHDNSTLYLYNAGSNGHSEGISLVLDDTIDSAVSNISLTDGSVIETLSFFDDGTDFAAGISIYTEVHVQSDSAQSNVSLSNDSAVLTATITEEPGASAYSGGVRVVGTRSGISLDNDSHVMSVADSDILAFSVGIDVAGVDADISLTNGSTIEAIAFADTGEAVAYGIYHGNPVTVDAPGADLGTWFIDCDIDGSHVDLDVDASSAIIAEWAAYSDLGTFNVNNSGLLAGRLQVTALNNNQSGVLAATLAENDTFVYSVSEANNFYFRAESATLAAGSTFRINNSDNLGLNEIGDSANYALLQATTGNWSQEQLNLVSGSSPSPLMQLSWNENSDAQHLILTATYLSPQQAGLSTNATGAYSAAVADGRETFASTPEQWIPNVSGAAFAGTAQTVNTSQLNIGKRLGSLQGMNSGDEIVANNGLWFSIQHTEADQNQRSGISGFDAGSTALSLGYDREINALIVGVAYTKGSSDAKSDDNNSDFDMADHLFSLYASYDAGKWYGEAIVSTGFGDIDSVRTIGGQTYEADYDSNSLNGKLEAGLKLAVKGWQLNPILALEYSRQEYDSYNETGDALALHVKSQDYDRFTVGAGARIEKELQRSWGSITPELKAMVYYDLDNDRIVSTANFIGGSSAFVSYGVEPAETSWQLGTALTIASLGEQNVNLRLGYDYCGREDFDAHSFSGKVQFSF